MFINQYTIKDIFLSQQYFLVNKKNKRKNKNKQIYGVPFKFLYDGISPARPIAKHYWLILLPDKIVWQGGVGP
jgi:hypothetical protein